MAVLLALHIVDIFLDIELAAKSLVGALLDIMRLLFEEFARGFPGLSRRGT